MERLTGKELRRLSEFLRDLYRLRTHEEFADHVITALPTITEGEFTSYNEFYENGTPGFYKCDQVPYCRIQLIMSACLLDMSISIR